MGSRNNIEKAMLAYSIPSVGNSSYASNPMKKDAHKRSSSYQSNIPAKRENSGSVQKVNPIDAAR